MLTDPVLVVTQERTRNPVPRPVWIFDNMINSTEGAPEDGGTVAIFDTKRKFLGSAIYNSKSRIRARIFSLRRRTFDEQYIDEAVRAAVKRRLTHFTPGESFRAVFGDADHLPGVVADKLGSVLVLEILTLAADRQRDTIVQSLTRHLGTRGVVIQRESSLREKEGLDAGPPIIDGDVPRPLEIALDDYLLLADPVQGQKTGLYLDQRWNRRLLSPHAAGRRVLDLFCYNGGWALSAAAAGCAEAVGVDSSAPALSLARDAAARRGFAQTRFEEADAFDYLNDAHNRNERFDIVVSDPPAFARGKTRLDDAMKRYLSLNYRCMRLIPAGGILAACSCSQPVRLSDFEHTLELAARNAGQRYQLIARGGPPPDHPEMLGLPATSYLKCILLRRTE